MAKTISIEPGPAEAKFRGILTDDGQLALALQSFCRQFSENFTDLMGEDFTLELASSTFTDIGKFQCRPEPTQAVVRRTVRIKPLPVAGCLTLSRTLAVRMVEQFLGESAEAAADRNAASTPGSLSETEERIVTKFCDSLLRNFESAFEASLGVRASCAKSNADPLSQVMQLPADHPCRVVEFQARLQELQERITLFVPMVPRSLSMLLPAEHDQTVALILSRFLAPEQAAKVLDALPFEKQHKLLFRIARMTPPMPGALEDIAAVLTEEWSQEVEIPGGPEIDGPAAASAIVKHLSGPAAKAVMAALTEEHAEVAESIARAGK